MLSIFLTPDYFPFAVAFVVMLGIGLIEAIGLGVGHLDLHPDIDGHADLGDMDGVLDWIGLGGGLPLLIWLTSLLCCFSIAGVAVQQVATESSARRCTGALPRLRRWRSAVSPIFSSRMGWGGYCRAMNPR